MTPLAEPAEVFAALQRMAREAPVTVRVRGGSMAPLFADGDHVLAAAARVYWPGDVVVFRAADGRLLVHRLLGYRLWKKGRWQGGLALVTRGDACAVPDAPVPLGAVLGRVAARPSLGDRAAALLSFLRLALRRLAR
ncbi:MAG TPA: S26 family signal peptidase [Thermoanaerobaculia bacterium]|nr:S26 family signal peptidase [Thermoanaerobaculia bacterium]